MKEKDKHLNEGNNVTKAYEDLRDNNCSEPHRVCDRAGTLYSDSQHRSLSRLWQKRSVMHEDESVYESVYAQIPTYHLIVQSLQ